jgi:hypothetical protein
MREKKRPAKRGPVSSESKTAELINQCFKSLSKKLEGFGERRDRIRREIEQGGRENDGRII